MNRFTLRLLVLAASILMSTFAVAEGKWKKTVEGCELWDSSPLSSQTVNWTGKCVDGKADGSGVQIWRDVKNGQERLFRIEAEMSDGLMQGNVKITGSLGFRFEGEYVNNLPHGMGRVMFGNGMFYIGNFQNGMHNGYGYGLWPNGKVNAGKWQGGVWLQAQSSSGNEASASQQELEADLMKAEKYKEYVDNKCEPHPSCPDVKKFAAEEVERIKAALQRMAPNNVYSSDMR